MAISSMDQNKNKMDNNNIPKEITFETFDPVVNISNYHPVPAGWFGINHRTITDFHFMLIIKGRYLFWNEKIDPIEIGPGDVVFNEPSTWHSVRMVKGKEEGFVSSMHCEMIPNSSWKHGDYSISPFPPYLTRTDNFTKFHDLFRRCAEVFNSYSPLQRVLQNTIAKELLVELANVWFGASSPKTTNRVSDMVDYLKKHALEDISRQTLAKRFNLTPEHVNLLFRRELKTTPTTIINRERCLKAWQLIQTEGNTIQEAAYKVGFHDSFYFSRVFKKIFGISPSSLK